MICLGKFVLNVTEDRNCALFLNGSLDFESHEQYVFDVEIMSLQGFINRDFAVTQVTVNVQDVNDNKPYFVFPFEGENVSSKPFKGEYPRWLDLF